MTFEEWFAELKRLAAEKDIAWFISEDVESYREYYDDGDSPEYCLKNQIDHAD